MQSGFSKSTASLVATAMIAAPVAVAAQERDLQGARAPGAETQMQQRGYMLARTGGGAQFWWNDRTRTCVRVVVSQGRYASVTRGSDGDCGKGGPSAGAVVGAALAVGLIAALAGKKKRGDTSAAHDGDYERGYNDGLYGAHYDRHDSEGYHDGYIAGETEAANRRAYNRPYVQNAPRQARDACKRRADEFQSAPPGTSVPISVTDRGRGMWEMTMATGHYRSRCTVDARGYVQRIDPYY